MSFWRKLFSFPSRVASQPRPQGRKRRGESEAAKRRTDYIGHAEMEDFYREMSRDLIVEHGSLVRVEYLSHFPKFEINFVYEDGTSIYSGERTSIYDVHFMSLGYIGEGPRYARYFLAATGFDLSTKDIDSIRHGDTIVLKDGVAQIMRQS